MDRLDAMHLFVRVAELGSFSRAAIRRPMVDLPAPIIPISTMQRLPSAEAISASWDGPPAPSCSAAS